MSSDLSLLGGSFYSHSIPEMVDRADLCVHSDPPFSPFCDSPVDSILQTLSNDQTNHNPPDDFSSIDQFASVLSSSPPSYQFENLIIDPNPQLQSLDNGFGDFSGLNCLEVKSEESQLGFDYNYGQSFAPHSYSSVENMSKYMQRSYSSNSFDGKPNFTFQPRFDSLMESQIFSDQSMESPDNSFFAGQMRRVCSTGDLQNVRKGSTTQSPFSSPLATERSLMEEANSKVGRYSAEERKERISKYRAKRNQRNFNKTIKYACRKTLADNRPRIRGRFARNDEIGEIPKASSSARDDDEVDLWFDGLNEEDGGMTRRAFEISTFGQPLPQFQYYGCF